MPPSVASVTVPRENFTVARVKRRFFEQSALGVIYTTGLWMVGLDLALLIGMFAGIVSFVPYLGLVVGILVAGFAAILQFHGEPARLAQRLDRGRLDRECQRIVEPHERAHRLAGWWLHGRHG